MAHLLGAETATISYPNRQVLDAVSLGLDEGDRIGVVGRNGDGKSSLLGLLAGRIAPHGGRVTQRRGLAIGYLAQDDQLDERASVRDIVAGGAPDHVWASQARVRDIVGPLVGGLAMEARVGELSGGQRRRLALAGVLAADVDALFLDEPTNHLDLEAIAWLAGHLKSRWPPGAGALVVVTHDRWFLDEVAQTTWEVHDGRVESFEGGYAAYILARLERDRQTAAIEARRRNVLRKELAWLRRGAPARTSKPKFRLDAAATLIGAEPPPRDAVELVKLATARLGKDVIDIVGASAAYDGGPPVLRQVTWLIGPGDRVGLLGRNGAGKSTLLALATGQLAPVAGRVKRGKTVRVATLTQHSDDLEAVAERSVRDVIGGLQTSYAGDGHDAPRWSNATGWVGAKEMTPGQILERLGFSAAHLATEVGALSGGQRRRLQIALVLLSQPNVLILDEPANDLDTDMLAALEDLLDGWPGTLIVVSHDRYLMERVTDSQYAILDGHLRHLPGGVEEYLRLVSDGGRADGEAGKVGGSLGQARIAGGGFGEAGRAGGSFGEAADAADDAVFSVALSVAEARDLRKQLAAIERRLTKARQQVTALHETMAAHDPTDYVGLAHLTADLNALETQIAQAEDSWLEAATRLESAQS